MLPRALAFLSLLLLAGCLESTAITDLSSRDESGYRLVLVDGSHRHDVAEHTSGVCGFLSLPEIDEAARTIVFHNEAPPTGAKALVLATMWDRSMCGTASIHWATLDEATGETVLDLPALGRIPVEFREDGSVLVDGQPLTPGSLTIDAGGDGWNATARFRDMGTWPDEYTVS